MKNAETLLTPQTLLETPVGSTIRITEKLQERHGGTTARTAYLTWRETRDEGTYFGYQPTGLPDSVQCTFGCSMLRPTSHAFGLQAVALVASK
jgi:hypothetical protein